VKLLSLDHADVRVASIAAVEPFYDAVLIPLGLSRKQRAHVAEDGEWHDVDVAHAPNAVEYHTPVVPGEPGWFIGFIEDESMDATATRLAFALRRIWRRWSRWCGLPAGASLSFRAMRGIRRCFLRIRLGRGWRFARGGRGRSSGRPVTRPWAPLCVGRTSRSLKRSAELWLYTPPATVENSD